MAHGLQQRQRVVSQGGQGGGRLGVDRVAAVPLVVGDDGVVVRQLGPHGLELPAAAFAAMQHQQGRAAAGHLEGRAGASQIDEIGPASELVKI